MHMYSSTCSCTWTLHLSVLQLWVWVMTKFLFTHCYSSVYQMDWIFLEMTGHERGKQAVIAQSYIHCGSACLHGWTKSLNMDRVKEGISHFPFVGTSAALHVIMNPLVAGGLHVCSGKTIARYLHDNQSEDTLCVGALRCSNHLTLTKMFCRISTSHSILKFDRVSLEYFCRFLQRFFRKMGCFSINH